MSHHENYRIAYDKLGLTSGKVSCGKCNKSVDIKDCEEFEADITDSVYTYMLTLLHKECKKVVAGVCV